MEVKMETKKVAPPRGTLLDFKQYGCFCEVEEQYENGKLVYYLYISSTKDTEKTFYHDYDNGLGLSVKKAEEFHTITSEFPESYNRKILNKFFRENDDLLAKPASEIVINHDERQYANELAVFIGKYGFLFPLPNEPVRVPLNQVTELLDRIFILNRLISELKINYTNYGKDYFKIFYYVCMLSLRAPLELHYYSEDRTRKKVVFKTKEHLLAYKMRNPTTIRQRSFSELDIQLDEEFEHLLSEDYRNELKMLFERVNSDKYRYQLMFPEEYHTQYDLSITPVDDLVFGKKDCAVELCGFEDYQKNKSYLKTAEYKIFKKLHELYITGDTTKREESLIFHFLYNFNRDISRFTSINKDSFIPVKFKTIPRFATNIKFTNHYQDAIIEIGRQTIKTELDSIIKDVNTVFDVNEMAPGWSVPSLYCAIHYSMFLNSGNLTVEKMCANPNCNRIFKTSVTNQLKIYCSDYCSGAMRHKTHMAKRLERNSNKKQ